MSHSPGRVAKIDRAGIQVSTLTKDVLLPKLLTPEGRSLGPMEVSEELGLREGDSLGELDVELADRVSKFNSAVSKYEDFWVEKLGRLQDCTIPYLRHGPSRQEGIDLERVSWTVPEPVRHFFALRFPNHRIADCLVAALGSI